MLFRSHVDTEGPPLIVAEMAKSRLRPTPDQFLAGLPPQIQELAQRLRRLVKHTVPNVTEAVYPGWKLIGYRVKAGRRDAYFGFIAPLVDRVLLGFEYGVWLSDPRQLLGGDGKQVRQVTIRGSAGIRQAELAALITEAARIAAAQKHEKIRLLLERENASEADRQRSIER